MTEAKKSSRASKTKTDWAVDELVLAKVKGFPAWPARVATPEEVKQKPVKNKVLVVFYGPGRQVRQCTAKELTPFTESVRNEMFSELDSKKLKPGLRDAVEEICTEFDWRKKNPSGKETSSAVNGAAELPGHETTTTTEEPANEPEEGKETETETGEAEAPPAEVGPGEGEPSKPDVAEAAPPKTANQDAPTGEAGSKKKAPAKVGSVQERLTRLEARCEEMSGLIQELTSRLPPPKETQ